MVPAVSLVSAHASFSPFRSILQMVTRVIFSKCKSHHVIPHPSSLPFFFFYYGGFKTNGGISFSSLWIWADLCDRLCEKNVAEMMTSKQKIEEAIPLPLGSLSRDPQATCGWSDRQPSQSVSWQSALTSRHVGLLTMPGLQPSSLPTWWGRGAEVSPVELCPNCTFMSKIIIVVLNH